MFFWTAARTGAAALIFSVALINVASASDTPRLDEEVYVTTSRRSKKTPHLLNRSFAVKLTRLLRF
jgi:hypothetical protein